jgi:hypothetical protein
LYNYSFLHNACWRREYVYFLDKFEDVKGVIRSLELRRDNAMTKGEKKDEHYFTKHYTANKRLNKNTNPTKTGVELRYSRRVSNSCSTIDNRRITLVKHQVISQARRNKNEIVTMTSGTYLWSSVTQMFSSG